jgi:hypothetical protein
MGPEHGGAFFRDAPFGERNGGLEQALPHAGGYSSSAPLNENTFFFSMIHAKTAPVDAVSGSCRPPRARDGVVASLQQGAALIPG